MKESLAIENPEVKQSFEEQFAKKEKIKLLDEEIEAVDIRPEKVKTEIPVLLAPGWGSTPEVFKDTLRIMSEQERRVLSLTHSQERNSGLVTAGPELLKKYPEEELRKAFALIGLLWAKGIKKTDVVAHSEAGINVAIAASLAPERFRNIVFVGPAGLVGKDSFPSLFKRFAVDAIRDGIRIMLGTAKPEEIVRLSRAGKETTRIFLKNPVRSIRQAMAISKSDTREMLNDLHRHGIGIGIIHGVDDPIFPMGRIQETMRQSEIDGFLTIKGNHDEIYTNPEKFIPACDKLLEMLEAKNNK